MSSTIIVSTSSRSGSSSQMSDLMPLTGRLPGDLSSAAFLIVAALIVPDWEKLKDFVAERFNQVTDTIEDTVMEQSAAQRQTIDEMAR